MLIIDLRLVAPACGQRGSWWIDRSLYRGQSDLTGTRPLVTTSDMCPNHLYMPAAAHIETVPDPGAVQQQHAFAETVCMRRRFT
jgi:hypothetical protein